MHDESTNHSNVTLEQGEICAEQSQKSVAEFVESFKQTRAIAFALSDVDI